MNKPKFKLAQKIRTKKWVGTIMGYYELPTTYKYAIQKNNGEFIQVKEDELVKLVKSL